MSHLKKMLYVCEIFDEPILIKFDMKVKGLKFAVIIAALVVGACGDLEKMKELPEGFTLKCTPNPVEVHANKVKATIEGTIPAKYFAKQAIVNIAPFVVYEGGELALPVKTLQGEDVQANNQVISFDAGGSFKHEVEYDYIDAMLSCRLEARLSITYKDKTENVQAPQFLAVGTVATYKLVETDPKPSFMQDNFVRVTSDQKEARIQFVVRKADIRKSELTKDDIKALNDFLVDAAKAQNKEIKELSISSYASPEGPIDFNTKLSADRGKNTDNYLDGIFKKAKVSNSVEVKVDSRNEDWEGFQTAVQASDIEDKDLVLRVLSMYSDPDVREKEIKNLSKVYKVLEQKILPDLRRSVMTAKIDLMGFSDDTLKYMVENNAYENLNEEEMLHAASLVEGDKQLEVYNKAAEKFNSLRAYNNIAFHKINAKDADGAAAALEKIAADDKTPAVVNNRGCVAMLKGDMETAQTLFNEAANAGPEVKYNLGILAILNNQYPAALEYFAGTDSFNQGLAALLNGKVDAAKNTFAQVETAKGYYGRAIVGARLQEEATLFENLRKAFDKDASLKDRAKKDAEFYKFLENEAFKVLF